ncbi:hypothetical protein D3C84_1014260 [compost metagenome]
MGSATDQKIRPMPMPALNSMAIQEPKLNSGWSSWAPSFRVPNRLTEMYSSRHSTALSSAR